MTDNISMNIFGKAVSWNGKTFATSSSDRNATSRRLWIALARLKFPGQR